MGRFSTAFSGLILVTVWATIAQAVVIETVPVGNPGNADDTHLRGLGAVSYAYIISKYEVTAGQYCEFLNAVAATDTYGLYNIYMWESHPEKGDLGCKIRRTGTSGCYQYLVDANGDNIEDTDWLNRPVNYVSFGDTARFANWLHNGQPTGVQNAITTEDGAYDLSATHSYYGPDGQTPEYASEEWYDFCFALASFSRKNDATWVIPTWDEWYKAAYHKNDGVTGNYFDFPTSSDTIPSNDLTNPDDGNNATFYVRQDDWTLGAPYWRTEVGAHENSESPYGTFDQGGNIDEWNETANFNNVNERLLSHRGNSGGSFGHSHYALSTATGSFYFPTSEYANLGFRVAYIPTPSTITLLLFGLTSILCIRRRK